MHLALTCFDKFASNSTASTPTFYIKIIFPLLITFIILQRTAYVMCTCPNVSVLKRKKKKDLKYTEDDKSYVEIY